jgi:hypothetical protein
MPEKSKKPPRRFIKRRYLVLLVLLFAAGYGLFANAHRISVEAQRLWLHYQLQTARQKWEANKPTAYRYEIMYQGPFQHGSIDINLQLTYLQGTLIKVLSLNENSWSATIEFPVISYDIENSFILIASKIDTVALLNSHPGRSLDYPLSVNFEFNVDYGYPKYIYFCEANVIIPDGCLFAYTITNFEVADNVIPFDDPSNP